MQHLDRPTVHCDILTRDDKHQESEKGGHETHLLLQKEGLDVFAKVEQYGTHDELHGYDPSSTLTDPLDRVKLHEGGPEDLEAERHRAEHYLTDLTVSQVLLENDWNR